MEIQASFFSILNGLSVVCTAVLLFPVVSTIRPPDPIPSLQPHYRAFSATTGQSVPVPGFSTLASRFAPLVLLPWHPGSGSHSSTQKPVPDSCPLYAGRRPSSLQAPDGLIPVVWTAPGFDDTYGYRRVFEGLLSLSFRTPTCPESYPGLFFRRSPPRLFTAAARTGLRPAPESRSRWAYHHLLRSFTSRFSSS